MSLPCRSSPSHFGSGAGGGRAAAGGGDWRPADPPLAGPGAGGRCGAGTGRVGSGWVGGQRWRGYLGRSRSAAPAQPAAVPARRGRSAELPRTQGRPPAPAWPRCPAAIAAGPHRHPPRGRSAGSSGSPGAAGTEHPARSEPRGDGGGPEERLRCRGYRARQDPQAGARRVVPAPPSHAGPGSAERCGARTEEVWSPRGNGGRHLRVSQPWTHLAQWP